MKVNKYKKLPKGGLQRLREFMRERNRKRNRRKEFVGRLTEGAQWRKTNDPGPY